MKVYHYDPITRVYDGQSDADPDPMQEGGYLVPAHATLRILPPLQAGQRAVFDVALDTWTVQVALPPGPAPDPGPVATLAEQAGAAVRLIDAQVDAIYWDVVGNRTQEYLAAEQQALAFSDAGFTGTVPPSVQSWSSASGFTPQQAAEDILAKASAWASAREAIRAQRLAAKAAANAAADVNALTAVMAGWAGFVSTMRAALGV
jgi:hypothetical protein